MTRPAKNLPPRRIPPVSERPPSRIRGRITAGLLLVLLAGVAVVVAWGVNRLNQVDANAATPTLPPAGDGVSWYPVSRQSFDLTITSTGELEAARQVELKSNIEGTTTIIELLPEGTQVSKGDVLVKLADDKVREKVETERLNVEQARADQIAAEQELAIEENEAANTLAAAKLKLELAQLDLAKWEKGDDVKEQHDLQLALEKATRTLKRAQDDLDLSKQLYEEQFISKSEVEDDELKLIEARSALETARLSIQIYDEYTRPKEQKKANSDVTQAKAELERTIRRNESRITQAKAKLSGRQSTLRIREERLEQLELQLEQTVIRAPQDGLVVYATSVGNRYRRRGDPLAIGREVRMNETLIILPDTSQMIAKLKVHEAQVARVQLGQPVQVTIDAQAQKPLEGKVTEIGVMAEDGGWMNPDLREYAVKVELPPRADGKLKPAMRCTGRILLGKVENQLAVPISAIFTEGRTRFVHVPTGAGKVRRQPVIIGASSETLVEIRSGIEEGERILLRQPRPGELEQASTSDNASAKPEAAPGAPGTPSTPGTPGAPDSTAAEKSSGHQPRPGAGVAPAS